jgi:hypothetical protein
MPPPRRGRSSRSGRASSFAPPELRGTLGTLLRTTLAQASAVRDALERGAREGRARFDDARHEKRRQEALAELGEIVLERVRRGELGELEQVPEAADAIAALDDLDSREEAPPVRRAREWVAPQARSRFDHARDALTDDGTVSSKDWKHVLSKVEGPPPPREPAAAPGPAAAPKKKGGIVFGAADDEDDDLGDYMHPDDVPAKK